MNIPLPKFSMVKIKPLTGTEWQEENIVIPDDIESEDDKKKFIENQKRLIKALKKFQGKYLFVKSSSHESIVDLTSYELFTPDLEQLEINEELICPIGFLEDELELVYDDVLNNCCKEEMEGVTTYLTFTCEQCGFSFRNFLGASQST